MGLRLAAASMLCAEAQYPRVNGYRQLDRLADNITAELQHRQHHLAQAS